MEQISSSFFIKNGWETSLAPREFTYRKEGIVCWIDFAKLYKGIRGLKKYFHFQSSAVSFVSK